MLRGPNRILNHCFFFSAHRQLGNTFGLLGFEICVRIVLQRSFGQPLP